MRTIRDVYKIGHGPSSSHTMGPARAARMFREAFPEADAFSVTLYGSLALTGKGHGTDRAILREFAPLPCEISFDSETSPLPHPNTLDLTASKNGKELGRWRMLSIGGGAFYYDESLASIEIPDSVTTIGGSIFNHCTALKSVKLPKKLKEIPRYAFADCTSLETINIPAAVTTISEYAFENCASLPAISIPENAELNFSVFSGCTALKDVTIPESATLKEKSGYMYT